MNEHRYHDDPGHVPSPEEVNEVLNGPRFDWGAWFDKWLWRFFLLGASLLAWELVMMLLVAVVKGDIR